MDPPAAGSREQPVVDARDLSKSFGPIRALDNVDLACHAGQIHALVGENGAGKSTLIQILSGVYRPDRGTLLVRGQAREFRSPADAERSGIVAVYQELSLIDGLDVAQNVYLHHEPRLLGPFLDTRRMYRDCRRLFESLGLPALDPHRGVASLSLADRQVVELARALSRNASLVIMDEPTSTLSTADQARLLEILRTLRDAGRSVIFISHRLDEVFDVADTVTVLRDGKRMATLPMAQTSHEELIQLMVGRDLATHLFPIRSSRRAPEPALEAERLTTRKLREASLAAHPGEIVGIAGLVGSGRTSLLRALFGADKVASGTTRVAGRRVRVDSPTDAVEAGIAMVGEDRRRDSLALPLSVLRNTTAVRLPARAGVVDARAAAGQTREVSRDVGLGAKPGRRVRELSGGNQQKVALAKWLSSGARILLCDEPTRGIDVGAKAEIYALLRRLADEGMAIVFASSDLPEVLGLADRILVMHEGRIVAEFDAATTDEATIVRAASGIGV